MYIHVAVCPLVHYNRNNENIHLSESRVDFKDYSLDFYAPAIHAIVYLFLYYEYNLMLMYAYAYAYSNFCIEYVFYAIRCEIRLYA